MVALFSRASSMTSEKKTWKSLIPDHVNESELTRFEKLQLLIKFYAQKFRLGSHYRTERFAITFFVLASALTLVLMMGAVSTHSKKSHLLNDTSVYTKTFVSSKTGINGSVDNLYVSSDRKTALLLMKFDQPDQVSTNAENYQSFLMGSSYKMKQELIKEPVSGQIISFGSTGYLGVELKTSSEDGFPSQIMNLVMRANEQIIAPDKARVQADAMDDSDQADRDETFNTFDQWQIYMNPGSKSVKTLPALDADKLNVKDVFYQTVTKSDESEIRDTLKSDLDTMNADLAAIREYKSRIESTSLDGAKLSVPDLPVQVRGDTITCVDQKKSDADSVSQKVSCDPEQMRYHPQWVAPNGFNFDWQDGSVDQGYINKILPKGQSALSWFAEHQSSNEGDSPEIMDASKWKFSNGRTLESYMSGGGSDLGPIRDMNSSITLYQNAIDTYYQDKIQYQVQDLGNLLGAEMSLKDVADNSTINDREDIAVRVLR